MKELMLAFAAVLRRAERFEHHEIQREQLSTRERMSQVLAQLQGGHFVTFRSLFDGQEGKLGVVVNLSGGAGTGKRSLNRHCAAGTVRPHPRAGAQ